MSAPYIHQAIIDQLIQPKIFMRVSSIMTPRRKLVSVCLDDRVKQALAKAKEGAFDQLPVLDKKASIVGLIFMDELQDCSSEAMVSEYLVPLAKRKRLKTRDGISKTLRTLHKQPASLVADKNEVTGLVHRSDLNKYPARAYFYVWLSRLEMELARFVDTRLPENSWIDLLSKKIQIQVLDRIEYESRRDNNIAPIEYLDLSHLIRIIAKNEALRCELGFSSRKKFNKQVGGLIDLRQTIMHPVRTLVSDAESMDTLVKREKRLRSFRLTVKGTLE